MAAASFDEGDEEGAAYLYRFADRMELEASDDEDSAEQSESAAVNNLAAADNEFVGAFNRLAQVDAFDRGAFKGAEELNRPARLETLNLGRLNMMSGATKPPSDTGEPGSFTFPSSSDDPNGRFHARPASFGRGRGGLLTPQPRLRGDSSFSSTTALQSSDFGIWKRHPGGTRAWTHPGGTRAWT